ncbi:hypothetical protein BGW42_006827 [Actinomortierella wolfii]|nr:hypothetical protein BGW42_006827 [Actinomortierella wolfii]
MTIRNPTSADFDQILGFMQEHRPKVVLTETCQNLADYCDFSCSLARSATANDHGMDEDRNLYDAFKRVAKLLFNVSSAFYVWKHNSSLEAEITTAWNDVTNSAKAILESRAPEIVGILLGSTINRDILSKELQEFKTKMEKTGRSLEKAYKIFDGAVSCVKEGTRVRWTTNGGVFIDEASLQETRFGHLGHLVFSGWNDNEVFTAKRVGEITSTTREDTLIRTKAITYWMRFCEGIVQVHKIQFPDLIIYGSQNVIPLDKYLAEHELTRQEKWRLALKIASALSFVHECKIIHRDIRAANVFMVEEQEGKYEPKLAGFEICRCDKVLSIGPTDPRDVWAAPERRKGHGTGPKTDVFSFGVLMYEIAMGLPPEWTEPDTPFGDHFHRVEQNVAMWAAKCHPFAPSSEYLDLMQQCLSANEEARPEMPQVLTTLSEGYFQISVEI